MSLNDAPSAKSVPGQSVPCRLCVTGRLQFFAEVDGTHYLRCQRCEATMMAPQHLPDAATEEGQYRLHRNDVDDPGYRRFVAQLTDPLARALAPGASGLDYGCGPGPVGAVMLREAGFAVAEYDPFFAPDPAALTRTYDFVFCSEVAEHFHAPAAEFARLDTLLKPGGLLAIMTTFERPERDFATWHYRRDPTHVVFYRRTTFQCIAHDRGWQAAFPAENVAMLHKPAAQPMIA